MRSSLPLLVGLIGLIALVSAPEFVIQSAVLAAALLVGWRVLTHRNGPLRRKAGR